MTTDGDLRAVLERLAARIIPADAALGLPGADDEAIVARVLAVLAGEVDMIRAAIAAVAADGPDAIADALLAGASPCLAVVVHAVAQAYYTDRRVLASLGIEARPPFPGGFLVDEGDWSLLDPVREREPFWRDVPAP